LASWLAVRAGRLAVRAVGWSCWLAVCAGRPTVLAWRIWWPVSYGHSQPSLASRDHASQLSQG